MNRDAWIEVNRAEITVISAVCRRFPPVVTGPYRTRYWAVQCYSSHVEVILSDRRFVAKPGDWSIMPPQTARTFKFMEDCQHRIIHFWSELAHDPSWKTALLHCGDDAERLKQMHIAATRHFRTQPERASTAARHILWELADYFDTRNDGNELHPAVDLATAFIEENYSAPLTVADAVAHSGVSHNHLTSLFRQTFGVTIVEYIRDRRTREAKHMLQQTDMPIKQIAIEVGIPDLQHFNRTIHRQFNSSPRALRAAQ